MDSWMPSTACSKPPSAATQTVIFLIADKLYFSLINPHAGQLT
jgi:hypothetical protein